MMIAAVAFDKEGNPSPVYRHRFICTRDDASDAQEFVDYYMGTITTYASTYSASSREDKLGLNSLVIASDTEAHKEAQCRVESIRFTR
jgi:hypothetical protein